jgi:hypothetical protein
VGWAYPGLPRLEKEGEMKVKIDRRARRVIERAGGLLTLDARATASCLVTTRLATIVGKPEEPDGYAELDVDGITVFVRGVIETPDGASRPLPGAVPAQVRVRERDGQLVAEAS